MFREMRAQTATRQWQIRVSRQEVCYIRFLLEAYEGVAGLSTLDAGQGLLEISVPPGRDGEWELLLQDLQQQIMLEIIHEPVSKAADPMYKSVQP